MQSRDEQRALDEILALDVNEEPRPGFDTRFFARLAEAKGRAQRRPLAWGLGAFAASAAALLLVLTIRGSDRAGFVDEIDLAQNLELAQDLEVVTHLDDVEAFEVLAQLDPQELEEATPQPRRRP